MQLVAFIMNCVNFFVNHFQTIRPNLQRTRVYKTNLQRSNLNYYTRFEILITNLFNWVNYQNLPNVPGSRHSHRYESKLDEPMQWMVFRLRLKDIRKMITEKKREFFLDQITLKFHRYFFILFENSWKQLKTRK